MSLELRLLGTLEVQRDGRPVALPPSKKTRALLAYLVATARSHTRAHLCELLWDGPDDPRAALRWSLTKIRPLLDDPSAARVLSDHELVSFQPEGAAVDLADVRTAIGPDPARAVAEVLILTAQRFRGEFLEGLDLADCYRYHEWWAAEREAVRGLRIAVLSTLVDRLRDNPEAALTHARERVLVDPFSEAAHISVIELLGLSGRVREALQQYESCRRMLEGQLGAKPSAALERARTGLSAIRSVFAPRVSSTPPAARATASRGVLWITGEPGIGKTRLLEDVADQTRTAGGIVLAGRSYEAEMVRPYGAWIDALRSTAIRVSDATVSGGLALLLPELGGAAEANDRYRLFDAVAQLLEGLTEDGRPLALILDDVHWFDEASAGLLHFVSRALAGSRVLIACARVRRN